MNMKIPTSTARVQVEKAGAQAVAAQAITKAQLDALLRDPVLAPKERDTAKHILGALRAQLEIQGPDKAKLNAMIKLSGAMDTEVSVKDRINACQKAFAGGAIDEAMYRRLTSPKVGLRGRVGLYLDLAKTSRAVKHYGGVLAGASAAGPEVRLALEGKLRVAEGRMELLDSIAGKGLGPSLGERDDIQDKVMAGVAILAFLGGTVACTIAAGHALGADATNHLGFLKGELAVVTGLFAGGILAQVAVGLGDMVFPPVETAPPNTPVPA